MEKLAALTTDHLWWRYPTFSDEANSWTLRDLSLEVQVGECFGITGPSGAGKTTLCRALIGILPYNARLSAQQLPHHFRGAITLLGQPITNKTTISHQIGMVLQDPENQFLRMSLLHELAFGLQIQGLPHDEILQRAHEALVWVGLEHLWPGAAYIHPSDLSGGQKQRVAIAAFLAMRPQVLILDEPTSDLDPVGKREVIETIARLRRDYHMTVILVEQDPEILAAFCDRIALLHEGRIRLIASPRDFYAQRSALEGSGAAASELVRISWQTGLTCSGCPPLTLEEGESTFAHLSFVPEDMGSPGRRVASTEGVLLSKTSSASVPGELIIQAKQVTYHYEDGSPALKGIDFDLYRGEMLALLGPNGSGKTTFAKILVGLFQATSGQISVLGQSLAQRKVRRRLSSSIGYVFQNPDHQLFCRSVSDEIEYGLKNLDMPAARRAETVKEVLEAVGLSKQEKEDPVFLSKGERQRLAVAAVLAMGPDILIVDEPTTGQDYRSISNIMNLLRSLQLQGKTILIITHDMTLVAEHCQRVVSFRNGLVTFNGTPAELFTCEDLLAETGLRAPVSAILGNRLRLHQSAFPALLTVTQWVEALAPVVSEAT